MRCCIRRTSTSSREGLCFTNCRAIAPGFLLVCRACSTAGRCKSCTRPDGGEGLAKRKGKITLAARLGPERSVEQRGQPMNNSPDARPTVTGTTAGFTTAIIGPGAEAFPSASQLASWAGVCPGRQESAGESTSNRSAKGTARYGACWTNSRLPLSGSETVTYRSCSNASRLALATRRPSGQSLIVIAD